MDMGEPRHFQAMPKPKIRALAFAITFASQDTREIKEWRLQFDFVIWRLKGTWGITRVNFPLNRRRH